MSENHTGYERAMSDVLSILDTHAILVKGVKDDPLDSIRIAVVRLRETNKTLMAEDVRVASDDHHVNKLFKLASSHYLIVHRDAPYEVVPTLFDMYGETPARQAKHLRDLADEIEAADRRITERKK